jgi:hypothetical protein
VGDGIVIWIVGLGFGDGRSFLLFAKLLLYRALAFLANYSRLEATVESRSF